MLEVGGACGIGGHHRVRSMPHHEESAVVRVVRVRGVICELLTCRGRLTSSFSALLFAMADFATIVERRWRRSPTLFGVEAPPSCEGSSMASVSLPKL